MEYFNLDQNCDGGAYSFQAVQRPVHGTLAVVRATLSVPDIVGAVFGAKSAAGLDPRSACKLMDRRSAVVVYTPAAGYSGLDSATLIVRDRGYESAEHLVFRILPAA